MSATVRVYPVTVMARGYATGWGRFAVTGWGRGALIGRPVGPSGSSGGLEWIAADEVATVAPYYLTGEDIAGEVVR